MLGDDDRKRKWRGSRARIVRSAGQGLERGTCERYRIITDEYRRLVGAEG